MNKTASLQVGFARVNVNPQMGMEVRGYYQSRKAIGVLDDLELNVVAVNHGDDTVLIMALDNCNMPTDFAIQLRTAISEKTSVPTEAIFIHSIHTHTGPDLSIKKREANCSLFLFVKNSKKCLIFILLLLTNKN